MSDRAHESGDQSPHDQSPQYQSSGDSRLQDRWPFYHLLILVVVAIAAGRIAVVKSPEGDTAFLSANDRSRWSTVASLVERGTYEIDQQIAITNPKYRNRRPWDSIDKVRHLGRDGKLHYYSSKPPLLATIVAGVYKLVSIATGMTLTQQPLYVARLVLALFNLPLLVAFLYATIASMNRVIRGRWASQFAAAACCFGMLIVPFTVTLSNHLPACTATAVVMWLYLRSAQPDSKHTTAHVVRRNWMRALLAGLAAAFAVANELPALSMFCFWFVLFAWQDRRSVIPFALGAAVVAAAIFGTNWIAHQSLRPPYAHRGNGAMIAELDSRDEAPGDAMLAQVRDVLPSATDSDRALSLQIEPSDESNRWVVRRGDNQFALLKTDGGWQLRHWDDWYEYPGTYWKPENLRGVDRGEPSRLTYLLHVTVGHHGLFSLTPLWLLLPLGFAKGLGFAMGASSSAGKPTDRQSGEAPSPTQYTDTEEAAEPNELGQSRSLSVSESAALGRLTMAVLIASAVCLLFYVSRPLIDRNYGGVSICFRWFLWFTPLWLLMIAPAIDRVGTGRWGRVLMLGLLAGSVFSVSASLHSPWQSPWLYQFWRFLGWLAV